jgi:Coenzyme PQQ synthesis protein D (PqqD)
VRGRLASGERHENGRGVGRHEIWKLLGSGSTVGGICEALGGRYPVDREVLAADVRGLVEALAGAGLVEAA